MDAPKVSVVMSVYNGEKYLKKAVDSVLNQTFRDFEFIIINDGSTDSTADILRGYNDGRMKIIYQANIGLTKSLNKGIALARGEYIARQDADDISLPSRFAEQVKSLDSRPDIFMVTSWYMIIDGDGHEIIKRILPDEDKVEKFFEIENMICHGSVMFRKNRFIELSGYHESLRYGQDRELWKRMISNGYKFLIIERSLYKYRISIYNVSLKKRIDPWLNESKSLATRDKMQQFWIASLYLQQGEPEQARLVLTKLISAAHPFGKLKYYAYYLITVLPSSIQLALMWKVRMCVKILLKRLQV